MVGPGKLNCGTNQCRVTGAEAGACGTWRRTSTLQIPLPAPRRGSCRAPRAFPASMSALLQMQAPITYLRRLSRYPDPRRNADATTRTLKPSVAGLPPRADASGIAAPDHKGERVLTPTGRAGIRRAPVGGRGSLCTCAGEGCSVSRALGADQFVAHRVAIPAPGIGARTGGGGGAG